MLPPANVVVCERDQLPSTALEMTSSQRYAMPLPVAPETRFRLPITINQCAEVVIIDEEYIAARRCL